MISATSSAQAFSIWHIFTGYVFEIFLTVIVVSLTIGVATKFLRKLSFYDRI